ncbi:methyl-accepting chemotaxis protein [Vibrio sp. HN007]|uniref:methyl-accepting chemotaxis protein n=1 Tax=Vibrio iocasae TaxID=3098914 RepID=UPI0035D4D12F
MINIISRLSVARRLGVVVLVFVIATIVIAADIIVTLDRNRVDSTIVNMAGRQRMLTKKFASEVMLSVYEGHRSVHNILDYNHTATLYELSLNALQRGGKTFADLSMANELFLPENGVNDFVRKLEEVSKLWLQQKSMAMALINSQTVPTEEQVDNYMLANQEALVLMHEAVLLYNEHAEQNVQALKQDIILISLVGVLVSIFAITMVGRTITKPIDNMVEVSLATSQGDLEDREDIVRLINKSELGVLAKNIQSMRHALSSVVKGLKTSATHITKLSSRVEVLAQEVNSSYQDEKSKYEQISHISDELISSFEKVSGTVRLTLSSANESQVNANKGLKSVNENMNAVELATVESQNVSENIQELRVVADQVYNIIDVIQTIAEQTNLLALNAAIEAARAGEQGRGFAVVADEVRVLAQKTNDSTIEISTLLNQLTERVSVSVESVDNLQAEVLNSKQCSHNTEQNIKLISTSIQHTVAQQNEIASLIDDQSRSIDELKTAQDYLTKLLESTNDKITSSSKIAVDMNEMAKGISATLDEFSLSSKGA